MIAGLLIISLCLSFYGIGLIWMLQLIIFRSWQLTTSADQLQLVRSDYWKKIPSIVFLPVGILFILTVWLLFLPLPAGIGPLIWLAFAFQILSHILTGFTWGRWERLLSIEHHRPDSPLLSRLISTHWIRVVLVTLNGLAFLAAAMELFTF